MNIGLFTNNFPYKLPFSPLPPGSGEYMTGGVGEVAYQLSHTLARRDHSVVIFTTSANDRDAIETVNSIILFRKRKTTRIADTDISLAYLHTGSPVALDLVHLHAGEPPATLAALQYLRRHRLPFIVTHHLDPDWGYGSMLRRILVFLYAHGPFMWALAQSDRIIALSEEAAQNSRFLPKFADKLTVIPNGINPDEFSIPIDRTEARSRLGLLADEKIVLFMGTISERKGPQILIAALPKIRDRVPDTHLVLAGAQTPFSNRLNRICREMGLSKHVSFPGYVREDEKALYYRAADLFVLPSFSEAFPLTVMEAAASGLPAVVSDIAVFRALVREGETGLFTRTGDTDELATAISSLLDDEQLCREMGENAKEWVKQFSWDAVALATDRLYRELIGASAGASRRNGGV